jgi:hypothetical protein
MKRNAVGPTQSLSFPLVHPIGQHPSPFAHIVIAGCVHTALHVLADPVRMSAVQALVSGGQVVGQFPSQVSGGSTTPFPQLAMQLASFPELQPIGQQPSPPVHIVIGACVHTKLQLPADPVIPSVVHGLLSLHDVGQFPSQVSPGSVMPLPHEAVQSLSLAALQPGPQQPSELRHIVIGLNVQTTLHDAVDPVRESTVQVFMSSHDTGHAPVIP